MVQGSHLQSLSAVGFALGSLRGQKTWEKMGEPFPQKMPEGPKSWLCFPGTQLAQDNFQLPFHYCIKSMDNPMELKSAAGHSEIKNPTQKWNSDEQSLDY